MAAKVKGRLQLFLNALRHVRRVAEIRNAVEQDRELVTTQAGDHINFADAMLKPARHRNQQLIADRVAQTVVHVLEAIEVEKQNRKLIILMLLRAFDYKLQILRQQSAIRQTRQRVVKGRVPKVVLAFLELDADPLLLSDVPV